MNTLATHTAFARSRRARATGVGLLATLLVAGACDRLPASTGSPRCTAVPRADGFPVSIDNCGSIDTYTKAPTRVVTLNQQATEILLALGLKNNMVGTAWIDDAIQPRFRDAYAAVPVLSARYPSIEVLLAARPDLVYGGFASAFASEEGRSRDDLRARGIPSYLATEVCAAAPITLETVFDDLRNLGIIFGVSQRAEVLIGEMRASIEATRVRLPLVRPLRVLIYDSGTIAPLVAGGRGIANAIVSFAGGENLFADLACGFCPTSWEEVVSRDPEVILVLGYGDTSVAGKREFVRSHPALAGTRAVRENRFVTLPLSSVVAGVRNAGAVADLAKALFPEAFR